MKKLLIYCLVVLMLGGIFSICLQDFNGEVKEDAPVISSVLECFSPAVAYADSDTVSGPGGGNPPPPPPID